MGVTDDYFSHPIAWMTYSSKMNELIGRSEVSN